MRENRQSQGSYEGEEGGSIESFLTDRTVQYDIDGGTENDLAELDVPDGAVAFRIDIRTDDPQYRGFKSLGWAPIDQYGILAILEDEGLQSTDVARVVFSTKGN